MDDWPSGKTLGTMRRPSTSGKRHGVRCATSFYVFAITSSLFFGEHTKICNGFQFSSLRQDPVGRSFGSANKIFDSSIRTNASGRFSQHQNGSLRFGTRQVGVGSSAVAGSTSSETSTDSAQDDRMPIKKGSTVALVTPMTEAGHEIDLHALRSILRWHVESQTDGLCILGTTGEATTMTMAERETVLRVAVEEVKGKMPIIAGTGTVNPNAVKEQTLQAIDLGCDACLIVTPYYVKPPQRCLVKHYHDAADLGLPVVAYNVPGRTGVDLTPDTFGLVAEHPKIAAFKEATGEVSRVSEIKSILKSKGREDILLVSGDDGTCGDFVLNGGDGCISVSANVAPAAFREMLWAGINGDAEKCHSLDSKLSALHERLFLESNPIPTKWALSRMGRIPYGGARPPLDILDSSHHSAVEEALSIAGLL